MNPKLLTIAIPTYNRANFLDLCLERIVEEVANLSNSQQSLICVYVSNNASTDDTITVLEKYQNLNTLDLKVVHHQESIGGNNNIVHCYQSVETPYAWVMGDDDVILQGGLLLVLAQLKSQMVDVLYLSGYPYVTHYLEAAIWGAGQRGTIVHQSAEDFVRHTHVNLTFITAVVVRSNVCLKNHSHVLRETYLPQLSWVFALLNSGRVFVTLKDRIYAGRMDNSGGYGAFEVFGQQMPSIAQEFFGAASKISKSIENGLIVVWFPIYILNLKLKKSRYLQENVEYELRNAFDKNWRFYVFLLPLMLLPNFFAKLYFQPLRIVRRIFSNYLI